MIINPDCWRYGSVVLIVHSFVPIRVTEDLNSPLSLPPTEPSPRGQHAKLPSRPTHAGVIARRAPEKCPHYAVTPSPHLGRRASPMPHATAHYPTRPRDLFCNPPSTNLTSAQVAVLLCQQNPGAYLSFLLLSRTLLTSRRVFRLGWSPEEDSSFMKAC